MYHKKAFYFNRLYDINKTNTTIGGQTMEKEALLKTEEVARLLGVSPLTIRAWRFQQLLPCVRLGRAVRYRLEDIEKIQRKGLKRNGD